MISTYSTLSDFEIIQSFGPWNNFRSGSGRKFMTGDDKVVLHERIFLGRYRQTVLCEGEGPITCIRWRGRFAAWISRKVRRTD